MADIKIFKEGESILASDTNSNNNILLGKIEDHYVQVDNYVKGELGTIKSEVGSAKADLENRIDEVSTTIKQSVFDAISPDYTKGEDKSSGFTAPSYGQVYVEFKAGKGIAYADGKVVAYNEGDVNYHQPTGCCFMVGQGVVVTATNYKSLVFYPCKGFKEAE